MDNEDLKKGKWQVTASWRHDVAGAPLQGGGYVGRFATARRIIEGKLA